jgi:tRNA(Ile)-lysidine synthase
VRRRRGGESLKAHHLGRTRRVQHLCQAQGVLPWMRDALPLLYAGETLLAVGDLWLEARCCVAPHGIGWGVVWEDAPQLV